MQAIAHPCLAQLIGMSCDGSVVWLLAAPEVVSAVRQQYDGRKADMWSCGVMLYVMLFHSVPLLCSSLCFPSACICGSWFVLHLRGNRADGCLPESEPLCSLHCQGLSQCMSSVRCRGSGQKHVAAESHGALGRVAASLLHLGLNVMWFT